MEYRHVQPILTCTTTTYDAHSKTLILCLNPQDWKKNRPEDEMSEKWIQATPNLPLKLVTIANESYQ